MLKRFVVIILLLLSIMLLIIPTLAQSLSSGCTLWDGFTGYGSGSGTYTFNANDQLVGVTSVNSGSPTQYTLQVNGSTVSTAIVPGGTLSYTFPSDGSYLINVFEDAPQTKVDWTCGPASATNNVKKIVNPCPHFHDGRINNCDDAAQIVIYPHQDGLVITDMEGENLLLVTPELIAAVDECPASNTLIASGGGVDVYRLAGSCEFSIIGPAADGKKYYVLLDAPYANIGYTSFEE